MLVVYSFDINKILLQSVFFHKKPNKKNHFFTQFYANVLPVNPKSDIVFVVIGLIEI